MSAPSHPPQIFNRAWARLTSDPDPLEIFSIGAKLILASVLAIRASDPNAFPPATPGGLIAILGRDTVFVAAGLYVLAAVHLISVLHTHLYIRRGCAIASAACWAFFGYVALGTVEPIDVRPWIYLELFAANAWINWRLWRPGVTHGRCLPTPSPSEPADPASSADPLVERPRG